MACLLQILAMVCRVLAMMCRGKLLGTLQFCRCAVPLAMVCQSRMQLAMMCQLYYVDSL